MGHEDSFAQIICSPSTLGKSGPVRIGASVQITLVSASTSVKQIYVVSDEDYERESQLSNKVVIKKSVSDKKDTSRLSGDKVSKEDESLDDFKY